jgi:hypothetical protein
MNTHLTIPRQASASPPPDHIARETFCQWLLAKYIVNTQFLDNILFTDEVGFTRDGIMNFRNTHTLVDDVLAPLWHQDVYINFHQWVGILGDQL